MPYGRYCTLSSWGFQDGRCKGQCLLPPNVQLLDILQVQCQIWPMLGCCRAYILALSGPAPWLKAVQVVLTRSAPEAGMTQQLSMRPNVERSSVSNTRTRQPRISSSVACMCIRLQPPLPA